MSLHPGEESQIDALYHALRGKFGGQREDYFVLLHMAKKFGAAPFNIGHQVSFGAHDCGIDGFYFDRDSRNLHLYQGKLTEDHNQFAESMERMADAGLEVVFGSAGHASVKNDMLVHLCNAVHEHRDAIQRVYIHFLFKGDVEKAERSEGLDCRREKLLNKGYLINDFFNRNVELHVKYDSHRPGKHIEREMRSYSITMDQHGERCHDGRRMLMGAVRLMDLCRIYQTERLRFLERNIRAGLSTQTAPNRKIRAALKKIVLDRELEPTAFIFHHNGMSLAASKIELRDGQIHLFAPKVLNGAQTLTCLDKFLTEFERHRDLKRSLDRLEALEVNIKIIEDDPSSDLVTDVTIGNNQQNHVKSPALRSMDKTQVDLADKFREQAGIFYARQEGSFALLTEEDKAAQQITSKKEIPMEKLARTFLSLQGELSLVSHLSDVFESRDIYERTFKRAYLEADVRKLILVHKVNERANHIRRNLMEYIADGRSTETTKRYQNAIDKGRAMVGAMLIQAVLNDSRLSDMMEEHGTDITSNSGVLNAALDEYARARIAPVLKTLLKKEEFRQKLKAGKHSVLTTRESFRQAMKIAKEKFSWRMASV